MTPREVLLKAAELVERGWTQSVAARGRCGRPVVAYSRSAVCWCSVGALYAAAGDVDDAREALSYLTRTIGVVAASEWNDAPGRTQAEVVAALKAAAETCA